VEKNYLFIIQCKGDISYAFETAKIIVFDPKMQMCPYKTSCCVDHFVVHVICAKLELQVLKVGRFWLCVVFQHNSLLTYLFFAVY